MYFFIDELSLIINILSIFIFMCCFCYTVMFYASSLSNLFIVFIYFCCYGVFISNNFFSLYLFFELSLIPIFILIIKWGSYPDRSKSAIIILAYTLTFRMPVLVVIIWFYLTHSSLTFYAITIVFIDVKIPLTIVSILFLCFAVKLPIYGLHLWLPIAHVEAPVFGSVILAAILLKLGGVGLYRSSFILDLNSFSYYIHAYALIFLVVCTLICCYQLDYKRLIAYSSVSHIIPLVILLICNNLFTFQSFIFIMIIHGFSSSLMFILVYIVYEISGTRMLVILRRFLIVRPLLSLFFTIAFFFNLSTPPFPSFIGELFFIMSSFFNNVIYSLCFYFIFLFFSLVYNLNWYALITFYSTSIQFLNFSFSRFYAVLIPILIIILNRFFILFIMFKLL